jgi:MinD superfamily P-loop ATPase
MTVQVTVISGKGGTGKTTVTASLATLFKSPVIADCDVDASNLHILLKPSVKEKKPYFGHKFYEVDADACTGCGACETHCRFDAIRIGDKAIIDPIACESCGVCREICPAEAISPKDHPCGEVYISETEFGPMVHARLDPGMGTAGKLVTMVREEATKIAGKDGLVLIDGPPGIGCPVIASLAGADIALIVIEPTVSGFSDFKRVLAVARQFKTVPCVCINKYDLNEDCTRSIEDYCAESHVQVIGQIPYDRAVFDCVRRSLIPVSCAGDNVKSSYIRLFDNLNQLIDRKRSENR